MLKLQNSGHLMQRTDSLKKTLMLGKIEGRRRGHQRMGWLDGITSTMDMSLSRGDGDGQGSLVCCSPWGCRVGHDLGEESLNIQSCPLGNTLCAVTCHPVCRIAKCSVVGSALGPASAMGMSAVSPGVPQALLSQNHQCRSTEFGSQVHSCCAPGPAMGTMEAAQPCLHVHVPKSPRMPRLDPFQSQQHLCLLRYLADPEFTKPAAVVYIPSHRERFQPSFLRTGTPGAQLWFQPCFCTWTTH